MPATAPTDRPSPEDRGGFRVHRNGETQPRNDAAAGPSRTPSNWPDVIRTLIACGTLIALAWIIAWAVTR